MTPIKVQHAFGTYTGELWHDYSQDPVVSRINIDFGECVATEVLLERDPGGAIQRMSLLLPGGKERKGIPLLFNAFAAQWLTPEPEGLVVGDVVFVRETADEKPRDPLAEKGLVGEQALNDWLRKAGLSYLYVNQAPETFANLFHGNLKRPDFLVLLESIGLIAVDAKNRKCDNGEYTLQLESELRRVLTFERLFRIPVWYAYLGEQDHGSSTWYWISALKALEVGVVRRRRDSGEEFIVIKQKDFERIERNEDLGKLYTHRLPSLRNIASVKPGR
jgi:hypothetical protein